MTISNNISDAVIFLNPKKQPLGFNNQMIKILEKVKKKLVSKKDRQDLKDNPEEPSNGEMIKLFNFFSIDDCTPLRAIDFNRVLIKKKWIKSNKGEDPQKYEELPSAKSSVKSTKADKLTLS